MSKSAYFLNVTFKGISKNVLFEESSTTKHVITVNADFIVRAQQDQKFRNLINNNYATLDGQIPFLLAKKANPLIPVEKVSGSDLIYDICNIAKQKNRKVFLLGGHIESNAKSVQKLKELYNIDIVGYSPPFCSYPFPKTHNDVLLGKIVTFKPDYLLVGFGMIKQEYWIDENLKVLEANGVKIAVGVGGTFDFVSGRTKRAPIYLQKLGVEWLYRIKQEPRRLLKRYLISNTLFIWYYLKSLID